MSHSRRACVVLLGLLLGVIVAPEVALAGRAGEAEAAGVLEQADDVPYPPRSAEDVLQHLYKLDPMIAEAFQNQKRDLELQWQEVRRMAHELRKERERIQREYPAAPEHVGTATSKAVSHTVALGESLAGIAHYYGVSVEELYLRNRDVIDRHGLQPNAVLVLPSEGMRSRVVSIQSLQSCESRLHATGAKLEICHAASEATRRELKEAQRMLELDRQMEADAASSSASIAEMQRLVSELKNATKACPTAAASSR